MFLLLKVPTNRPYTFFYVWPEPKYVAVIWHLRIYVMLMVHLLVLLWHYLKSDDSEIYTLTYVGVWFHCAAAVTLHTYGICQQGWNWSSHAGIGFTVTAATCHKHGVIITENTPCNLCKQTVSKIDVYIPLPSTQLLNKKYTGGLL